MLSDSTERYEMSATQKLAWSRLVVTTTIVLALTMGFVITHLTIREFLSDVRDIKARVRSIEQKVDENTMALKKVETLEGVDFDTIQP